MREPSRRKRQALIEKALALGIRRFDTAPLYGLGKVESEMGAIFAGMTTPPAVTSKYGLQVSATGRTIAFAQRPLRELLKRSDRLRQLARRSVTSTAVPAVVSWRACVDSLNRSLDRLQIATLQDFMLHEVPITPEWIAVLDELDSRASRLRTNNLGFAMASTQEAVENLDTSRWSIQIPWTGFSSRPIQVAQSLPGEEVDYVYSVANVALQQFEGSSDALRAARRGGHKDNPSIAAKIAIGALVAMRQYPKSVIVVGTSKSDHLVEIVEELGTFMTVFDDCGQRLFGYL